MEGETALLALQEGRPVGLDHDKSPLFILFRRCARRTGIAARRRRTQAALRIACACRWPPTDGGRAVKDITPTAAPAP
jgi:hypothetical protein